GKPMILIPTPSHTEQLNNAKRVAELGVAEVLDQNELTRDLLEKTIKKMLDGDYAKNMEEIRKVVSKLNGLKTATETILEVAEKGQG
ncbi:hypothetical protein CW702_01410, partial [Candidatus Bathyarchaeota archaeon]